MPFNLPPLSEFEPEDAYSPLEMTQPPTDAGDEALEPDWWTGLKARLKRASEGRYGEAFDFSKQVRIPEEEQTWAEHIPGVGALDAGLNVMRGATTGVAEALYRKALGVPEDAPFSFTDPMRAAKVDWARPHAPVASDPVMNSFYAQAVEAWKRGDKVKAAELLKEYQNMGGFVGAAYKAGGGLVTDPTMMLAPQSKLFAAAIAPGMVESTIRSGKEYVTQAAEKGITSPEAMSALPEVLVSGGFLGLMGAHHLRRKRPDLAAAVDNAKAQQPEQVRSPEQALLAEMQAEARGLRSTEGLELRDIPTDVELTPESARKVQVMAERVLGEANAALSSGELVPEGQPSTHVGPSGVERVVVLPSNEIPTPNGPTAISGLAARVDNTIFITKEGAQSILQARDAAEALTRTIDAISHETPHPVVNRGWMGPMFDPMTGAPLTPEQLLQRTPAGGHSAGDPLAADNMKDTQHLFIEEALRKKLYSNQALREWAGQAEAAGWLKPSLLPRSDIPVTAGTYPEGLLSMARQLTGGERPLPIEAQVMGDVSAPEQMGSLRRAIDALREGWGKKKGAAEQAGVGDPRFAEALRRDLIRRDIRENPLQLAGGPPEVPPQAPAPLPKGPVTLAIAPMPRLGPLGRALIGDKVDVPERFPATRDYISRIKKPIGHRGRFGKWNEVLSEIEGMVKEGGGASGAFRKMGIEVGELRDLVNSLRVAATAMAHSGNPEGAAALRERINNLTAKAPRATGTNLRRTKMTEGIALPRTEHAQLAMEEPKRPPTKRQQRRATRYAAEEAREAKRGELDADATAAFHRFQRAVQAAKKPTSLTDAEALRQEALQVAAEMKGKLKDLTVGQRESYLETLQNLVTSQRAVLRAQPKEAPKTEELEGIIEEMGSRRSKKDKPRPKPTGENKMALDEPTLRFYTGKFLPKEQSGAAGIPQRPEMFTAAPLGKLAEKPKRKDVRTLPAAQLELRDWEKTRQRLYFAAKLATRGKNAEALSLLKHLTTTEPDSPEVWRDYSRALAREGRTQEAATAMERSRSLLPRTQVMEPPPGEKLSPEERAAQDETTKQRHAQLEVEEREGALRRSKAFKRMIARQRAAAPKAKPALRFGGRSKPERPVYSGPKLADLPPSELQSRQQIIKALEAAKDQKLDVASYSEGVGLTVEGKPISGKGAKVKVVPQELSVSKWIKSVIDRVNATDPHASAAGALHRDLRALNALREDVHRVIQTGRGSLTVSYDKLLGRGFTSETAAFLARAYKGLPKVRRTRAGDIVKVIPMRDRAIQYRELIDSFRANEAWTRAGITTDAKGTGFAVAQPKGKMRNVPHAFRKRLSPEVREKVENVPPRGVQIPGSTKFINSRLHALVQVSRAGKVRNLVKDYVQHLKEGVQTLLKARTGPYGGRREDMEYTIEVSHLGKKTTEKLIPLKELQERIRTNFDLPKPLVDRVLLKDLGKFPDTGKKALYSYTEAMGLMGNRLLEWADRIGAAAAKANNKKALAVAERYADIGARLHPSNFKLESKTATRKPVDITRALAEFRKGAGPRPHPLEYHSFEGGKGVPTSLNPARPAPEPIFYSKNPRKHRVFDEELTPRQADVVDPKTGELREGFSRLRTSVGTARGLRQSKWTRRTERPEKREEGPSEIATLPETTEAMEEVTKKLKPVSTATIRSARVISALEQKGKAAARLMAAMRTYEAEGKQKAAMAAAKERIKKDLQAGFNQIDDMVSTLGLDKDGSRRNARLHTKLAIYNMAKAEYTRKYGPESARLWAKNNPYNTFRPEKYYNDFLDSPAWEKWTDYLSDKTGEVARPRADTAGEYWLEPSLLERWKREVVDRGVAEEMRGADEQLDKHLQALEAAEAKAKEVAGGPKVVELPRSEAAPQRSVDTGKLRQQQLFRAMEAARKEGRALSTEEAKQILNPPPDWESPKAKARRIIEGPEQAGARRRRAMEALPGLAAYSTRKGFGKVRHRTTNAQEQAKAFVEQAFEMFNVTRPLRTAADLSNPFRNTWQLSYAQLVRDAKRVALRQGPAEESFVENFTNMVKAFGSDQVYKALEKNLEGDQFYQEGKRWGLRYATEGDRLEGFMGREALNQVLDAVRAKVKKTPLIGKQLEYLPKGLEWVIKGSERSYNYYQNKVMRDGFKHAVEFLTNAGEFDFGSEMLSDSTKFENTMKDIVGFLNNASSRSRLREGFMPKGQRGWTEIILNGMFYSAQMNLARLKMLGNLINPFDIRAAAENAPSFQLTGEGPQFKIGKEILSVRPGFARMETKAARHYARMQTLSALAGALAGVGVVYSASSLAGLEPTVETDSRSTDFMKVRMGPASFDGWGGLQQFVRAGSQIMAGKRKEIGSGKLVNQQPLDTMTKLVRSKLGPGAQLVVDTLQARTGSGEAFDLNKDPVGYATTAAKNMLLPMSFEDIGTLMKDDPRYGFLIPLMLIGHGVSAGQGAKESWLSSAPGLREKDTKLMREFRAQGVTGPRLSHKITLPGKDIYGKRNYYNMTPGEVKEFEGKFMPMITDLLYQFVNSPAYQALPASKRPAALQRRIHLLNANYGANKRVGSEFRERFVAGKLKASGTIGAEQMELASQQEAERLERAKESTGKMEAF